MSHVVSMTFPIDDLDCLDKACEKLGLELKRDQKTFKWYGRWVNDYNAGNAAYRQGIDTKDYGKCAHAIGVKGNSKAYEIGLVPRTDGKPGYQMAYDFFSGGFGLMEKVGKDASKLCQEYSVQQNLKRGSYLQQQGFAMTQQTDSQGRVHLTYKRGW
jgi:hypothetical protein